MGVESIAHSTPNPNERTSGRHRNGLWFFQTTTQISRLCSDLIIDFENRCSSRLTYSHSEINFAELHRISFRPFRFLRFSPKFFSGIFQPPNSADVPEFTVGGALCSNPLKVNLTDSLNAHVPHQALGVLDHPMLPHVRSQRPAASPET